jgi:hypothetical protein
VLAGHLVHLQEGLECEKILQFFILLADHFILVSFDAG